MLTEPADFAEMALELHGEGDVEETLNSIIDYAGECLASDYVGIHIVRNRKIETAASTHDVIRRADEAQTELGEGPCLQAVWDKSTMVVDDTAHDERWPRFGPVAAELGLHSILSVRMHTSDQTLGAINFYCKRRREFSEDDIALAHVFAQHASVALATAQREEGLRQAVDARHLIGQAQGILMERYGLTADKAFAVLRRYSQHHNIKLRSVAQKLVDTRELPPVESRDATKAEAGT